MDLISTWNFLLYEGCKRGTKKNCTSSLCGSYSSAILRYLKIWKYVYFTYLWIFQHKRNDRSVKVHKTDFGETDSTVVLHFYRLVRISSNVPATSTHMFIVTHDELRVRDNLFRQGEVIVPFMIYQMCSKKSFIQSRFSCHVFPQ